MKKRIISAFLAAVMAIGIIPFGICPAYAEDDVPWSDLLLDADKWNYNSWDITAESEQKIHVTSDIADEEYSLLIRPDSDSNLVTGQEKQVRQAVPFDIILSNYDNCVELIHILTNAVNGIGLSSSITKLKDDFSGTNDTAMVVFSGIKSAADITASDLVQAYKYVINPQYVMANTNGIALSEKVFKKIEVRSESNVSQVNDLIRKFDSDEIITTDILNRIMDERDLDSAKRNEARATMDDIVKKIDYLKEQKSVLHDKVNEYSKRYTDFSYQLPGEELTVIKAAGTSTVYGGIASMFGLPQVDAALISEQVKAVQTAYADVIQNLISVIDKVATSSASARDMDVVINSLIAMRCCMRLIGVYLGDLSAFWENTSDFCQNMIDRYSAAADAYAKPENGGRNYIEFFKDKEFTEAYLVCLADWSALKNTSTDLLGDFFSTREKCSGYLDEEETAPQIHFERAISSAAALSAKMKEAQGQSAYSSTVINRLPSIGLIAVILCGIVAALVIAKNRSKKKKDS